MMLALQLLKTYWKPLALLLLAAGIFWLGWDARAERCENQQRAAVMKALEEQRDQFIKAQEKAKEIGQKLEGQIATQKATINRLNRKLQDEVITNPVYTDCRPTPGGVQSINDAIAARRGDPAS